MHRVSAIDNERVADDQACGGGAKPPSFSAQEAMASDRRHVRCFCDMVEVRRRKRFQLTFVSCSSAGEIEDSVISNLECSESIPAKKFLASKISPGAYAPVAASFP